MKTEITVFYKRNVKTGEVLEIQSIKDCYSEVQVIFTKEEVTTDMVLSSKVSVSTKKDWLGRLIVEGYFYVQGEAKDIPSFGDVVCGIQTIEIDIDESKIGV
jgi:hypothetical protein